jgi:small GTP-binding protein
VAVLGRPNVGKSTLFNRLVGRQRAITDPTPGVTRDVLEGELDLGGPRVRLLDTGGYTLGRGELEREVSRRSLAIAGSCDLTLALVEAAGLTREDQALFERLRRLPGFPDKVVLVVNKVDGPKQELELGEFQALGFSRLAPVSAAHGRGIAELKRMIREALEREGGTGAVKPEAAETEGAEAEPAEGCCRRQHRRGPAREKRARSCAWRSSASPTPASPRCSTACWARSGRWCRNHPAQPGTRSGGPCATGIAP